MAFPRTSGIYQIRNLVTGKVYVGSAINLGKRWRDHSRDLNRGTHANVRLQRSWSKHGSGAFVFEVLSLVPDREQLIQMEQSAMDCARAADSVYGYNIAPRAGSQLGFVMPQAARDATAAGLRGRKLSDDRKAMNAKWWNSLSGDEREAITAKQSAGLRAAYARKSIEARTQTSSKISAALNGCKRTQEHRLKIATTLRGRKLPQEHKDKIAAGLAGHYGRPSPTQTDTQDMARLRGAGMSYRAIGVRYGVRHETVRNRIAQIAEAT